LLGLAKREPIEVIKERCRAAVGALPDRLRRLSPADPPYEVRVSSGLSAVVDRLTAEHRH
jgi:hypothetical protein